MKHHIGPTSMSLLRAKLDTQDDLQFLPLPEVEKKLETSRNGLSHDESQKRLAQYGPNQIEEKKKIQFLKLLASRIIAPAKACP